MSLEELARHARSIAWTAIIGGGLLGATLAGAVFRRVVRHF